jgi:diamine N-acetyltransferase
LSLTLVLSNSELELAEIASLAKRIWNHHYPAIIGQEQVDYMLDKFYALPALIQQVKEGQKFYIIKDHDVCIGFVALSQRQQHLVFIHKFYLDHKLQNLGFGKQVFDIIKFMHPQTTFELTVNRQNYKAINFYFKLGFSIKEVADFDIGNGYVMNDFVMVFS